MPTFRQLRTATVVAETHSLTKAARLLGTVPSVLSADIAALEAEYGCPLFVRDGRGMRPTEKGRELARRAEAVLASLRDLERDIKVPTAAVSGLVRVGLVPTLVPLLAEPLVAAARASLPDVALNLVEGHSGDLLEALSQGRLHLATLYRHQTTPGHACGPFWREPLVLIGAAHRTEVAAGRPLDLAAVLGLPLALPSDAHGLRSVIERVTAAAGVALRPQVEVDSTAALEALVASGRYFAIVPMNLVSNRAARGDTAIAHAPVTGLYRELAVVRLRGTRHPTVLAMSEIIHTLADPLLAAGYTFAPDTDSPPAPRDP